MKGGARVGAAALMLAFPLAAAAEGDQEQNGLDEVKILQSAAEDGYLRITLDTVSRSANKDNPDSSLVMLGFSVTNLTAAPVWLYHVHGYPMREYYDGSNCAAGTFQGQAIQTQMVLSDQMVKLDQSTDEGKNLCVSYGVNPGETIQLTITGSMASEAAPCPSPSPRRNNTAQMPTPIIPPIRSRWNSRRNAPPTASRSGISDAVLT